ncbi:MAG TPA: DUF3014 domain-containing protein [Burkholderiaceae bacterium]
MSKTATIAMSVLAGALAVGAAAWWLRSGGAPAPASVAQEAAGTSTPPSAPTAAVPVASAPPRIAHPVPTMASASSPPARTFELELVGLLGGAPVAALFRSDDFDRRFVATIDNLGRSAAPPSVWPVNPVGGRLRVAASPDGDVIGPDNGARYEPYVRLLEQVDLSAVVRLYVQHYPELQREYEALGFPGRYFNDRVVAVLDQLLATPTAAGALHVHLPRVEGPQPTRPWLLYDFDDPALRSLAAGQRLLLRMGPDNERRVKERLRELRRLLVTA